MNQGLTSVVASDARLGSERDTAARPWLYIRVYSRLRHLPEYFVQSIRSIVGAERVLRPV
jgi:hypothetical protein